MAIISTNPSPPLTFFRSLTVPYLLTVITVSITSVRSVLNINRSTRGCTSTLTVLRHVEKTALRGNAGPPRYQPCRSVHCAKSSRTYSHASIMVFLQVNQRALDSGSDELG